MPTSHSQLSSYRHPAGASKCKCERKALRYGISRQTKLKTWKHSVDIQPLEVVSSRPHAHVYTADRLHPPFKCPLCGNVLPNQNVCKDHLKYSCGKVHRGATPTGLHDPRCTYQQALQILSMFHDTPTKGRGRSRPHDNHPPPIKEVGVSPYYHWYVPYVRSWNYLFQYGGEHVISVQLEHVRMRRRGLEGRRRAGRRQGPGRRRGGRGGRRGGRGGRRGGRGGRRGGRGGRRGGRGGRRGGRGGRRGGRGGRRGGRGGRRGRGRCYRFSLRTQHSVPETRNIAHMSRCVFRSYPRHWLEGGMRGYTLANPVTSPSCQLLSGLVECDVLEDYYGMLGDFPRAQSEGVGPGHAERRDQLVTGTLY